MTVGTYQLWRDADPVNKLITVRGGTWVQELEEIIRFYTESQFIKTKWEAVPHTITFKDETGKEIDLEIIREKYPDRQFKLSHIGRVGFLKDDRVRNNMEAVRRMELAWDEKAEITVEILPKPTWVVHGLTDSFRRFLIQITNPHA